MPEYYFMKTTEINLVGLYLLNLALFEVIKGGGGGGECRCALAGILGQSNSSFLQERPIKYFRDCFGC